MRPVGRGPAPICSPAARAEGAIALPLLQAPARLLLQGLPDDRPASPTAPQDYSQRPEPLTALQLAELITVLGVIDAALADQAVAFLLARHTLYDMDSLLVPAAVLLNATGGGRSSRSRSCVSRP